MITKLTSGKHGYSIQVEPNLLMQWEIDPETPLELAVVDGVLVAAPVGGEDAAARREKIERVARDIHARFAGVFKELAK